MKAVGGNILAFMHISVHKFLIDPFYDLISILVQFITQIKTDPNVDTHELNCGGGFGIQYLKAMLYLIFQLLFKKWQPNLSYYVNQMI